MQGQLSSVDRIVLDRLLSKLASHLQGAIDFWTLVCIASVGPDPRGFIQSNSEIMRSLVRVTRSVLAESHLTSNPAVYQQLNTMLVACQKLEGAFLVLEQFRTIPLDEVLAATNAVAEVYAELLGAINQLGDALELSLTYRQNRKADWEEYYQQIINNLFDQFRQEREYPQYASNSSPDRARAESCA